MSDAAGDPGGAVLARVVAALKSHGVSECAFTLADIRSVVEAQATALDWSHVRAWLPKEEADVLESVATLDDETLARAFLPR